MSKIRATNEAIAGLAIALVSGPLPMDFEFLDRLDDVSVQTLHTLVSQCPYCGDWTRLEDGDCVCSHSEQQNFEDDPMYGAYDAWQDSVRCDAENSESENLPED